MNGIGIRCSDEYRCEYDFLGCTALICDKD
jgi:hypothetical protein